MYSSFLSKDPNYMENMRCSLSNYSTVLYSLQYCIYIFINLCIYLFYLFIYLFFKHFHRPQALPCGPLMVPRPQFEKSPSSSASLQSAVIVHLTVHDLSFHSMPRPSQDLSTQSVVKHSTNGLDTEQKASSTSVQAATAETRAPLSTATVASVHSMTRTEAPKITPSPSSQPISTDERSAAGQKTSKSVNERSRNVVKKESHGIRRAWDSFRAPEEVPEASQRESSRDSTKESKTDFLETPPSFESQPESQEVVQGDKVTFRCQGELVN